MNVFRFLFFGCCALLLLSPEVSFSQRCATVEYNNNLSKNFPAKETEQQFELWMQEKINQSRIRVFDMAVTSAEPYTIPVVVHVVHNGETIGTGINISTAQIKSQIDVLNKDYNRLNTDASNTPDVFKPSAGSLNIQFVLARQDPNGNPTNGITRTKGSKATWNPVSTSDDANLKASSYWPAEKYLNIWVTDLTGGNLGYTQLPESNQPGLDGSPTNRLTDGVVVDYMSFGAGTGFNLSTSYNLGRTTTHEVGHFFGLRHIWGDENGCATDYVDDTPFQNVTNNTCPTHPQASCDVPSKPYKMFQNYMDYTLDACMNLFTINQADRMRIIIENSPRRASLLSSPGATTPLGFITDIAITGIVSPGLVHCISNPVVKFNIKNLSSLPIESFQIQSSLNGAAIITRNFTNVSIDIGDEAEFQLPAIALAQGRNQLVITAVNPNDETDGVTSNNSTTFTTYLDQTTDIAPLRLTMDNSTEAPWIIAGAGTSRLWESVSTTKNQSVVYKAFGNPALNSESWFVSPVIDFSGLTKGALFYDVSYAQRSPNIDHLKVLYSTDCGVTYPNTLIDTSEDALGSMTSSTEWVPMSDNNWKKQFINIDELAGKKNVRLAFVAINGNGNNIYLDNIEIFASDSNIPIVPTNEYQIYYQNSNYADIALSFNLPARQTVRLQIYSLMGQLINDNILPNVINQTYQFDFANQASGLYVFRLQIGNQVSSKKVFIAH